MVIEHKTKQTKVILQGKMVNINALTPVKERLCKIYFNKWHAGTSWGIFRFIHKMSYGITTIIWHVSAIQFSHLKCILHFSLLGDSCVVLLSFLKIYSVWMQADIIHPNFTICKEVPFRRQFHSCRQLSSLFLFPKLVSQEHEIKASDVAKWQVKRSRINIMMGFRKFAWLSELHKLFKGGYIYHLGNSNQINRTQ